MGLAAGGGRHTFVMPLRHLVKFGIKGAKHQWRLLANNIAVDTVAQLEMNQAEMLGRCNASVLTTSEEHLFLCSLTSCVLLFIFLKHLINCMVRGLKVKGTPLPPHIFRCVLYCLLTRAASISFSHSISNTFLLLHVCGTLATLWRCV